MEPLPLIRSLPLTKLAVSVPQAAAMIGICRSSLYLLFSEGAIVPRKSGKRTLVLVSDIEQYVANLPAAEIHIGRPRAA